MYSDGSIEIIAQNVRIMIYTIYDQKYAESFDEADLLYWPNLNAFEIKFADENTFYPLSNIFKIRYIKREVSDNVMAR